MLWLSIIPFLIHKGGASSTAPIGLSSVASAGAAATAASVAVSAENLLIEFFTLCMNEDGAALFICVCGAILLASGGVVSLKGHLRADKLRAAHLRHAQSLGADLGFVELLLERDSAACLRRQMEQFRQRWGTGFMCGSLPYKFQGGETGLVRPLLTVTGQVAPAPAEVLACDKCHWATEISADAGKARRRMREHVASDHPDAPSTGSTRRLAQRSADRKLVCIIDPPPGARISSVRITHGFQRG
jgi:hypothetical protein